MLRDRFSLSNSESPSEWSCGTFEEKEDIALRPQAFDTETTCNRMCEEKHVAAEV